MSAQIRDPLKCGSCGESRVELFNVCEAGKERALTHQRIAARCCGCKEVTYIELVPPALRLRPSKKNSGSITGGWR